MTDCSRSSSYSARSYDRYLDRPDPSAIGKMQQQYWVTKQVVLQKLGRKEDEHIVASDAELDAKLELFHAVEHTSLMLQKVIELYQDKLLALSQEENCMGRFLKEQGKLDKTRAGKMMSAAGKSLSYTAQQRLSLRVPLVRLYQEVETFRSRAIADTLITVNHMENLRTDYRGALLWMKDVSQELDPDTYKQLDKFRKVQTQVRRTKTKFDKLKVDCLQKIDLLAASRCNMFSHALAAYQTSLLTFWKKTARTMGGVAESFKGYQHYEFSMLKELTEPSKKLAEETAGNKTDNAEEVAEEVDKDVEKDKDKLIFFEEYHDDDDTGEKAQQRTQNGSVEATKKRLADKKEKLSAGSEGSAALLDLDFGDVKEGEGETTSRLTQSNNTRNKKNKDEAQGDKVKKNAGAVDLLTDQSLLADEDKDDLTLLNEILSIPSGGPETDVDWKSSFGLGTEDSFNPDWQSAFGEKSGPSETDSLQEFLPSQLLDMNLDMGSLTMQPMTAGQSSAASSSAAPSKPSPPPPSKLSEKQASQKPLPSKSKKQGKDMSMWFDLFADLDPLANPDAIGKKEGDASEQDRNC